MILGSICISCATISTVEEFSGRELILNIQQRNENNGQFNKREERFLPIQSERLTLSQAEGSLKWAYS